MKNRKYILTIIGLLTAMGLRAQEYKVAKSTGRLEIHLGRVTVEGYNGNEIIFSSDEGRDDDDERAAGLRPVNSLGLDDNTGLGVNVTVKGEVIEVNQLKKLNSPDIKIRVPKGVIVYCEHTSQHGGDIVLQNMDNEVEVSVQYNSVQLEDVRGPINVKSIYGGVDAVFNSDLKNQISIVSVYGHVDATIPIATKANLKLNTSYGEILVAPELKIVIDKTGSMVNYSDKVSGKLNDGGVNIDLTASYGKIYLRKK